MKVVIIDDQKAMHYIISQMLSNVKEIEIVGSFQDTTSAFTYMMNNRVDLVFVDIQMPRENGLEFARRIRDKGWTMKLVFVTSHKEYALPAFDVYAYDYIVKPISQERLQGTIDRVLSEEKAKGEEVVGTTATLMIPTTVKSVTKREIDVLQLMSNGLTNREIAAALHLTEGTIKNHIVNIFSKLHVTNRVQAIALVKEFNLIS
jgi:DNA-binding NarL/FixJ family response regulator